MPFLPPDVRIARHLEKLQGYTASSKLDEILDLCGLARDGSSVHSREGFISDRNCYEYKQAVRDVIGETAYAFAKVNFVLAGCKCRDCE